MFCSRLECPRYFYSVLELSGPKLHPHNSEAALDNLWIHISKLKFFHVLCVVVVQTLSANINHCLPHIIEEIFTRHDIADVNKNSSEFAAINQRTVTKYITNDNEISTDNRKYDAIQMEVDNDYRGCEIATTKHLSFINAMIEIIYVLNRLYEY